MSGRSAARGVWAARAGGVAALLACAALAWNPAVRDLARGGLADLRWTAVAAAVAVQAATLAVCAVALRGFLPSTGLRTCGLARWVRDAGGNLLVFAPGLGEAAALRVLTRMGGRTGPAVAALALDTLCESVAQAPYVALGLLVSRPARTFAAGLPALGPRPLLLGAALLAACAAAAALALFACRRTAWLAQAASAVREAWAARSGALAAAFALHLLAWGLGGVQLYVAARLMGSPLALGDALALEGLVYGLRGVCAFVPGGLGVQEAALLGGGALFGLPPTASAALALVLRLRDLVVGAPALLAWAALESGGGRSTPASAPLPARRTARP